MSSSSGQESKPAQMKMVIGMIQNSYRVINQLITRVEELAIKLDDLNAAVRRVESSGAGSGQEIETNLAMISKLLLVQISSSLIENTTQKPVVVNVSGVAGGSVAPAANSSQSTATSGSPAAQQAPAPPLITEPENLRPSSLFKKLAKG